MSWRCLNLRNNSLENNNQNKLISIKLISKVRDIYQHAKTQST